MTETREKNRASELFWKNAFLTKSLNLFFCLSLLFMLCGCAGHHGRPESLKIVEGGKSGYNILIHRDHLSSELFAAQELQKYIFEITGARLGIREVNSAGKAPALLIGKKLAPPEIKRTLDSLPLESFVVKNTGSRIYIAGNDTDGPVFTWGVSTGTLFGVYYFLQKYCGTAWLFPGKTGEIVPVSSNISLPSLNEVQSPSFPVRVFYYSQRRFVTPEVRKDFELWGKRNFLGSSIPQCFHHSYHKHLKGMFGKHPEYFAFINGMRRDFNSNNRNQINTLHPEVVRIFARNVINGKKGVLPEYIPEGYEKKGGIVIASVSPNDGDGFCESAEALAQDSSYMPLYDKKDLLPPERVWLFTNKVAGELKNRGCSRHIGCFAYNFYRRPPKSIDKLEDNIAVMITDSARDYHIPDKRKEKERLIGSWSSKTGQLYVFQMLGLYYYLSMPVINTKSISELISFYKKHGIRGGIFYITSDWSASGLNYYLAARKLWNADASSEKIMDAYCGKAFGKAADIMKEYFLEWEKMREEKNIFTDSQAHNITREILSIPSGFIERMGVLLEKASESVEHKNEKERIAFFKTGFRYVVLTRDFLEKCAALNKEGFPVGPYGLRHTRKGGKNSAVIARMFDDACASWKKRDDFIRKHENDSSIHAGGYIGYENRRLGVDSSLHYYKKLMAGSDRYQPVHSKWYFLPDPENRGIREKWFDLKNDETDSWKEISVFDFWEKQGYGEDYKGKGGTGSREGYNGAAWYRTQFDIAPGRAEDFESLLIGAVDESCRVWLNGKQIGRFTYDARKDRAAWMKEKVFPLKNALKQGKNILVIMVEDKKGLGGIWKGVYLKGRRIAEKPDVLLNENFENESEPFSLGDTRWKYISGAKRDKHFQVDIKKGAAWFRWRIPLEDVNLVRVGFDLKNKDAKPCRRKKKLSGPKLKLAASDNNGHPTMSGKGYRFFYTAYRENSDWRSVSHVVKIPEGSVRLDIRLTFDTPGEFTLKDLTVEKIR